METRREYIEKLATRLLDWDAKIDELRAKAEFAPAQARLVYKKKVAELRELRERVAETLNSLHEAGDAGWQDIKKAADKMSEEGHRILKDVEKTLRDAA
jgi:hypothetical protein